MEKSKKRLLLVFLMIYLTVEVILFLVYIYHCVSGGPPESLLHDEMVRNISLILILVFGILSPIIFWKYIYQKK